MVRDLVARRLERLPRWLAAGLLVSLPALGTLRAQAPAQDSSQEAQSAQRRPPSKPGVFASDAGVVLNFIKPDSTADFEAVLVKLREALKKSRKPGRKQQALGWKVFRAAEPATNGSVLYLFVIDPAVKGQDYTVSTILAEAFPTEAQKLSKDFAATYALAQHVVNLTLLAALGQDLTR